MSDANRVALRMIEESTWNALPATLSLDTLRITGESLIPEVENITSQELRSDRMISDLVQVSRQNVGGFEFELSYATFDSLFEGALFGTWATDVLKNGTDRHSYAIEKALLDENEFFLFQGLMVNQFSLNLATSSIATGSFDFLGSAAALTQGACCTTIVAANQNAIMNCMANVSSLREGASSLTAFTGVYVQELSFSINNNLRPIHAIGSNTIQEIAIGKQDITGTLNAYFTSDRLFDQFLAGSATALDFTITDGTNSYTVLFPNVKFESESIVAPGQDQDVIENITWRALYDSSENSQVKITRVTG